MDGTVCRKTVASGTRPPCVQADTKYGGVVAPVAVCDGVMETHRLI